MLKVHEKTLLGRLGILRHELNAATWSRSFDGKRFGSRIGRFRGTLKVLPMIYGPNGTMGNY